MKTWASRSSSWLFLDPLAGSERARLLTMLAQMCWATASSLLGLRTKRMWLVSERLRGDTHQEVRLARARLAEDEDSLGIRHGPGVLHPHEVL